MTKRRPLIPFIVCIAALTALLVGCSGENKPSETDLRQALASTLPDYLTVSDFNVEAMANEGNEVEPRFIARYNASVEVAEALYTRDGKDGDVMFLKEAEASGLETEVFGKSMSVLYQGEWNHNVSIDGNTVRQMGRPRSAFPGAKTIIRGSEEEEAHFDAMEKKNAEFAATTAALPLESMITEFYGTKGEFAGRYEIHEVMAHRIEKVNPERALVHAKYSYKKPGASEADGEDRRAFTLISSDGQDWQIASMGFAGSGRVE